MYTVHSNLTHPLILLYYIPILDIRTVSSQSDTRYLKQVHYSSCHKEGSYSVVLALCTYTYFVGMNKQLKKGDEL